MHVEIKLLIELTEMIMSALLAWIPFTCRETVDPDKHNACAISNQNHLMEKLNGIRSFPENSRQYIYNKFHSHALLSWHYNLLTMINHGH